MRKIGILTVFYITILHFCAFGAKLTNNPTKDSEIFHVESKSLSNEQTTVITFLGRLVHYYSDLEGITHVLCDNYFQNETCLRLEVGTSGMILILLSYNLSLATYSL